MASGWQFWVCIPYPNMNCHPDRSVAKWRDLRFCIPTTNPDGSTTLPFVIGRACDFFDLFACFCTRPDVFQSPPKKASSRPERSKVEGHAVLYPNNES